MFVKSTEVFVKWINAWISLKERSLVSNQKAMCLMTFFFVLLITLTRNHKQMLPCGFVLSEVQLIFNQYRCAPVSTSSQPSRSMYVTSHHIEGLCECCWPLSSCLDDHPQAPWYCIYLESPFHLLGCFIFPKIILALALYSWEIFKFLLVWTVNYLKTVFKKIIVIGSYSAATIL